MSVVVRKSISELYDFVKLVAYYTQSMYMYSMYTHAYATRAERNCDDLRRTRIPAKPTKKSEKKEKKKKKRNRKKKISRGRGYKKRKSLKQERVRGRIVQNSRMNESSLL